MIVLDTNVVSELMRREPSARVVAWLDAQLDTDCFLTSITVAELRYGTSRLPAGRRKRVLEEAVSEMIEVDFADRVLGFGADAADHYGDIVAARDLAGRPISSADAQIASICRVHSARLATRNISDFDGLGLELIDPWHVELT